MKKLLLLAFMAIPLWADLRYDNDQERYYSTHAYPSVDEKEYHEFALMAKSIINCYYKSGMSISRAFIDVIDALRLNGSPAALQLAEDLHRMW